MKCGLTQLIYSLGLIFWCLTTEAQAQTAFASRYSNAITNGDITMIGNVNFYCSTTATSASATQVNNCNTARTGGSITNDQVYMAPIDTDSDSSTNNSSSATLNLSSGSTVLFAGLYWGGTSSSVAGQAKVNLAVGAGATTALTADAVALYSVGSVKVYQSFKDVTSLVQAAGNSSYTVSDIASRSGSGEWGSWTMVVAYKNTSLPTRNLSIFDGLQRADSPSAPLDISVSGFLTPQSGAVTSTIGVVAYDGDRGQLEGAGATPQGSLFFGATTSSLNPVFNSANSQNDVFNSTITALGNNVTSGRNPNYTNLLGTDIDLFTPNTSLPNGSTSAVVRVFGTSFDVIYPGIITLATDIYVPNIKDSLTKTVTDVNGGALIPGDELEYELVIKNVGTDGALNVVLSDPIPANTTFVAGSMSITGSNAGNKSDVAGDDQAEFDSTNNKIVARLGTGATATAGGSLFYNEESRVKFRVKVNAAVTGGTVISNTGSVTYKQQTLGASVTDISDSDPNITGDQPATITVSGPDLTISKTHTGTYKIGDSIPFTLTASNIGGAASGGVVSVTDVLPAGLTAVSMSGTGWACTLATLTCTRSTAIGNSIGSNTAPVITLTATATTAGTYDNKATVSGGSEQSTLNTNNSATDSITIIGPDLSISKTHTGYYRAGNPIPFTITVSNIGAASSLGVITVTDLLPSGLNAQSISGTGWTCTLATATCTTSIVAGITAPSNTLAPITLTAVASAEGTYDNKATVSGGGENPALNTNNTATDSVVIYSPLPNITLIKTVSNITQGMAPNTITSALPQEILEYCITFKNTGGAALNFVLKDTLPSQLQPLPDAYAVGSGLQLTYGGITSNLTSVADTDQGKLVGSQMTFNLAAFIASSSGKICFQGRVY